MDKKETLSSRITSFHSFVLKQLYLAQAVKATEISEDYLRGTLRGIEIVLDEIGIGYEKFNPLGYMDYED